MAATTVTSVCLALFALLILGLTAYGYYLVLWSGASIRPPDEADQPVDVDAAIRELREQIEAYERSQQQP